MGFRCGFHTEVAQPVNSMGTLKSMNGQPIWSKFDAKLFRLVKMHEQSVKNLLFWYFSIDLFRQLNTSSETDCGSYAARKMDDIYLGADLVSSRGSKQLRICVDCRIVHLCFARHSLPCCCRLGDLLLLSMSFDWFAYFLISLPYQVTWGSAHHLERMYVA